MKSLYIKQSILTKEEINALLNASGRFIEAGIVTNSGSGIDKDTRSGKIKVVDPNEHRSVNEKIMSLCAVFNPDIDAEAHYVREYNFIVYEKGDHFTWHRDLIPESDGKQRVYSSSTILSLTEDLKGGEFGIQTDDGYRSQVHIQEGETLLFDAQVRHCVYPVTQGKRIVLVAWIYNK